MREPKGSGYDHNLFATAPTKEVLNLYRMLLTALTSFFLVVAPAWPQAKTTVRVTGEGVTQIEAQQDAIRKALQLSLDQFVVQETIIVDEERLLDQISSSTNGFVERFEIVTSSGSEGHFVLVADVVVSPAGIKNMLGSSSTETVKVDISGVLAEAESKSKKRAAEKKKRAEKAAIEAAKVETNTRAAMALMQERFSALA